ncbi:hypothetical protein FRC06_003871 [Ceratobasidium sp. 370]|nr:hypothetical protein FRC06_003871 [Ceratobasidium sp. 370]
MDHLLKIRLGEAWNKHTDDLESLAYAIPFHRSRLPSGSFVTCGGLDNVCSIQNRPVLAGEIEQE